MVDNAINCVPIYYVQISPIGIIASRPTVCCAMGYGQCAVGYPLFTIDLHNARTLFNSVSHAMCKTLREMKRKKKRCIIILCQHRSWNKSATNCTSSGQKVYMHCASLSLMNRKMKHFPFIRLTHSNGKQSFPTITFPIFTDTTQLTDLTGQRPYTIL